MTTSDVSSSNSTVSASPLTLQAGSSSEVTVELRDGSNNLISGLSFSDFNVSVSGNGTAGPIAETTIAGTYIFDVTNTTAEIVTVTVTATGSTLNNQPEITFTAADPDLMQITTEPDEFGSVAGQSIEGLPSVRITDEFGNPVPAVSVNVTEQGGELFVTGSATSVITNSLGFAIFDNIAIEAVGQYNLVFSATGVISRTSNAFNVEAGPGDPVQTTATVPDGTAGQATVITINVTDEFGNAVSGVAAGLLVSVSGANTATPTVSETGTAGEYTASYTPVNSGTDNVAITLGGTGISGSPYTSNVSAGSASDMLISQQPGITTAGSSVTGPPTVAVVDAGGNPVSGVTVSVSLNGAVLTVGSTTSAVTDVNGVAGFTNLITETAGTGYTLTFDADAVGVANVDSDLFNVIAAGVSATASSVTSTSPHTANGTDASTVTIVVQDGNGNAISGLAGGDFNVNVGTNATAGTVIETTIEGTYEVTVTNTTVETVTVVITANGVTLDDQPEIIFQAGSASDMTITQQPTSATAGDAIAPAPSVEVTDGTNPVSGVDVTAILSGNDFTVTSTVTATTNASGIAEFGNLVIETAGTGYTITFDADAAGVADVISASFDVSAATAAVLNELSGSGQSAQISQALASPFVVEVVDGFGNPVSGETVGFSIETTPTDAAGQSLSAESIATDTNGQAVSTLTLGDKVGAYGVDAVWSTSTVNFTADAESGDASVMSVTTQPGITTAGSSVTGPPTVAVVDAGGNPVSGVTVSVSLNGAVLTVGSTTSAVTDVNGVAGFTNLITETAGTGYTLTFDADAVGVANVDSDLFNVIAAGVSATASSVTSTSPHTANGTDASTVTIVVQDGNGNAISGLAGGDFNVNVGTNATAGTVIETTIEGTYEVTVTNTTVETVTVVITANGVTLDDQPVVQFQSE